MTLFSVLMGLGVVGILIFCPWMIYLDKKKLPLTRQRIGCLISMVLIICAFALIPTVLSPEQATPSVADVSATDTATQSATPTTVSFDAVVDAVQKSLSESMKKMSSKGDCIVRRNENLVISNFAVVNLQLFNYSYSVFILIKSFNCNFSCQNCFPN